MKRLMLFVAAAIFAAVGATESAAARRPNIVFILADDLGYGDLPSYGRTDVKTPAIESLATQGVRFTNFYAMPECSPTRAAFITGRYQQRVGGLECAIGSGNIGRYDDAIRLRKTNDLGLPVSDTSIARILKDAGYATAIIGKWHLGYEPKFSPNLHGFDYAFYLLGGGADYFHHTEPDGGAILRLNGEPIRRDGYFTDLVTDEAVRFIERQADKPFFLYVPYTAPHAPYQGPGDRSPQPLPEKADAWDQSKAAPKTYVEMIERMDLGVGRILKALADKGIADNTLVVFASDNGGTRSARNAPLSGYKGQTFEGGIRVPAIVRWPGAIRPGTVSDQATTIMDFTASFARVGEAQPPAGRAFDGIDIVKLAAENRAPQSRTLFWRQRRGNQTWWAVRDGDWKLIRHAIGDKTEEFLFNLQKDIGEKEDLLPKQTAVAERLKTKLADWEKEVRPVR